MLSFHVKFCRQTDQQTDHQTDGKTDRQTTLKQYAPDLSIQGHKKKIPSFSPVPTLLSKGVNGLSLVRKLLWKRGKCRLQAVPPFPTMFSKAVGIVW